MAHCTSGAIRGSVSCSRTLRQGIELSTFWLLNDLYILYMIDYWYSGQLGSFHKDDLFHNVTDHYRTSILLTCYELATRKEQVSNWEIHFQYLQCLIFSRLSFNTFDLKSFECHTKTYLLFLFENTFRSVPLSLCNVSSEEDYEVKMQFLDSPTDRPPDWSCQLMFC